MRRRSIKDNGDLIYQNKSELFMKQSHYTETPYHYAKAILTMHEAYK